MASFVEHTGHVPDVADTRPLSPLEEDIPPPCYSTKYGEMDIHHRGFGTNARVADDGRVDINIKERGRKLSNMLAPTLHPREDILELRPSIPSYLETGKGPVPRMNIVIQIVGSRGDVQPFIALGQSLKTKCGHRVRIATHPVFKEFVEEHNLEFFSIGADPTELMAYMVKNPGLMPGFDSLRNGDVGRRRKDIAEIISGCWRSCFEAGDGTGTPVADLDSLTRCMGDTQPFVADAIIANPPSFAHIHCAEKLGIPLHLMFTMPWSPTQAFPHPLVNIQFSNAEKGVANFVSYALIEMLTWQGLGDIINRFRERSLGLEPISVMWAPGMIPRLRVPYTYCWSSALLPKPRDWGPNIDISGFFFLEMASKYTPPPELSEFLAAGPPPVYIGFGSIVIDDPDEMTRLIFEAIKKSGQRALISKGWGGIGAEKPGIPDDILMIGNCPHDWLFQHVSCVVHHGGAGTTAAGIACGKPTIIVPFFGDQPFWGSIVSKAGAGPPPIPHKQLTAEKLATAIISALEPGMQVKAKQLGVEVRKEPGIERGIESFHSQLHPGTVRCLLCPERAAVWRVKRTKIRLSAFAVALLITEGILDVRDLKLYRPREYDLEPGPRDPISGGAAALVESLVDFTIGFADFPARILLPLSFHRHQLSLSEKRSSSSPSPSYSGSERGTPRRSSSSDRRQSDVHSRSPAPPSLLVDSAIVTAGLEPLDKEHVDDQFVTNSERKARDAASQISRITAEEVIGAGRTASRLVTIGIKSPMNFALSVAKGFHNAPKLYGDDSVREQDKITGFQSGLRAAGKELGYGLYDGISGLVTQPLRGRKEGAKGVIKGIGKGIGGLVLKPGAGVFALAGYPLSGIQKEVQKLWSTSVECYIVACRTKQGYDEWNQSTREERQQALCKWYSLGADLEAKAAHSPFAAEWEAVSRILFDPKRRHERYHEVEGVAAEPAAIEKLTPDNFREAVRSATHLLSSLVNRYKNEPVTRAASQKNVAKSFTEIEPPEDEEQQQVIERALHASIAELDKAQACGDHQNAGDRALQACVNEARRVQEEIERAKCGSVKKDPWPKAEKKPDPCQEEKRGRVGRDRRPEKRRLTKEGLDAVAEYAIWKTLTEKRRPTAEQTSISDRGPQEDDSGEMV
ncbi:UDP-glucose,sterol transferase [Coccidioides immitis RMSCC 3703]|uniref:UDP-glucose,sterol transferase n=1 Tax=Coccidioides immitis RMSCC 3703 TaxID=454286 RepID=A0A0J8R131_COCIT|nr:UDP-glucose,sterol transferase [Coccidioides immitis RMSCC 3703]